MAVSGKAFLSAKRLIEETPSMLVVTETGTTAPFSAISGALILILSLLSMLEEPYSAVMPPFMSVASKAAGEGVWRLPLDDVHFEQIESTYGDVVNGGVGRPGASVGAAFIGSFVDEDQVWAHFDIAGVDYTEEDQPTVPKGYSGWGVRTLDEYLRQPVEE